MKIMFARLRSYLHSKITMHQITVHFSHDGPPYREHKVTINWIKCAYCAKVFYKDKNLSLRSINEEANSEKV